MADGRWPTFIVSCYKTFMHAFAMKIALESANGHLPSAIDRRFE
jgi:hypothetical protein